VSRCAAFGPARFGHAAPAWVLHGDARSVPLPDGCVDAVVTDPPYGLDFMGQAWDRFDGTGQQRPQRGGPAADARGGYEAWCGSWAAECLRLLRPGGHVLAFGGTRTWHRLACALEDAGLELRDNIAWLYASGFPKSLDVAKALDQAVGEPGRVVGHHRAGRSSLQRVSRVEHGYRATVTGADPRRLRPTMPTGESARAWQGWGTGLKPAFEPILVARKPLAGTVAANVAAHGTGALNIDGCRVRAGRDYLNKCASVVGLDSNRTGDVYGAWGGVRTDSGHPSGRWPPNLALDQFLADLLDRRAPASRSRRGTARTARAPGAGWRMRHTGAEYQDAGGPSRFFPVFCFQAKAPRGERPRVGGVSHPTVKPLELMRWLCRLVTPPGGLVLDPFAGSGTTGEAALLEGLRVVLVEREARYLPLIHERLRRARSALNQARPGEGERHDGEP
jgi:DNA methylase